MQPFTRSRQGCPARASFTDKIIKQPMQRAPGLPGSRQGKTHRPYSLAAPGRPSSLPAVAGPSSSLARKRGEWSAERRTSLPLCRVLSSRTRAPLGAPCGVLIAAPGRAFGSSSWRAFRFLGARPLIGWSRRQTYSAGRADRRQRAPRGDPSGPGRSPGAARVREERSSPARGRRTCPTSRRLMKRPSLGRCRNISIGF